MQACAACCARQLAPPFRKLALVGHSFSFFTPHIHGLLSAVARLSDAHGETTAARRKPPLFCCCCAVVLKHLWSYKCAPIGGESPAPVACRSILFTTGAERKRSAPAVLELSGFDQ